MQELVVARDMKNFPLPSDCIESRGIAQNNKAIGMFSSGKMSFTSKNESSFGSGPITTSIQIYLYVVPEVIISAKFFIEV